MIKLVVFDLDNDLIDGEAIDEIGKLANVDRFDELVKAHRGQITESSLTREDGILRMEVTGKLDPPISHEEALAFLKANDGVRRISV